MIKFFIDNKASIKASIIALCTIYASISIRSVLNLDLGSEVYDIMLIVTLLGTICLDAFSTYRSELEDLEIDTDSSFSVASAGIQVTLLAGVLINALTIVLLIVNIL